MFQALGFDPRYYQMAVQLVLLLWGVAGQYFAVPLSHLLAVFVVALSLQWAFTRHYGLALNPLSTVNTCFSTLLLLQAGHWIWMGLAVAIAVASKFWLRLSGRHLFNPSNFGIVLVLLLTDMAWVAHGKWGQGIWAGLLLAGLKLS